MMTPAQVQAISEFFRVAQVPRFAFMIAAPPVNPTKNALELIRPVLLDHFAKFLDRLPKLPDDVLIQFEQSERLLPKLIASAPNIEIETLTGRSIPVSFLFTPKSERTPILEMADHVLHRAQRARNDAALAVEGGWYTDVFEQPPSQRSLYVDMRLGALAQGGRKVEFLEDGRIRISWEGLGAGP